MANSRNPKKRKIAKSENKQSRNQKDMKYKNRDITAPRPQISMLETDAHASAGDIAKKEYHQHWNLGGGGGHCCIQVWHHQFVKLILHMGGRATTGLTKIPNQLIKFGADDAFIQLLQQWTARFPLPLPLFLLLPHGRTAATVQHFTLRWIGAIYLKVRLATSNCKNWFKVK